MRSVAIVPHLEKKEVVSLMRELMEWFFERHVEIRLPAEDASVLGHPELGFPEERVTEEVNFIVVLGGDGTILRTVRLLKGRDVPILGVNLGRFGFLTEVEVSQLHFALSRILDGKFCLEKRMMLECEVFSGNEVVSRQLALNEVVLGGGGRQRLLEFDVYINGEPFSRYASDGLIIATPTGSTAYSLSAGGPLVSPSTRLIILVPVCPHTLFGRSLVLTETDEIRVSCPGSKNSAVMVSVDGVILFEKPFDFVRVSASSHTTNLIKVDGRNFYSLLKEKLRIWDSF